MFTSGLDKPCKEDPPVTAARLVEQLQDAGLLETGAVEPS